MSRPLLLLLLASSTCLAADSWTGADKAAHATGSAVIASAVTKATDNQALGLLAAAAVGAAKEGWDAKHPQHHTASWKDFGADVAGALVGAEVGGMFIAPADRGFVIGIRKAF